MLYLKISLKFVEICQEMQNYLHDENSFAFIRKSLIIWLICWLINCVIVLKIWSNGKEMFGKNKNIITKYKAKQYKVL